MKTVERIFQAILFEVIVLCIIVPTSVALSGFDTGKMLVVGIGLSLFAMVWNYAYNIMFDKLMGFNRLERGSALRITHAIGFELGMVVITLPAIAFYLNITWLGAAILEAGFLIFILIYTFVFNLVYDKYQPYKILFSNKKSQ